MITLICKDGKHVGHSLKFTTTSMSTFLAYLFTQLHTMSRALLKTSLVGWLPSSNIIIIVIIRLTTPLTRKSQRIRPLKFDKTTQKPNKMREATLRNHHARYEARQPVCNIPQELQNTLLMMIEFSPLLQKN